MAILYATLFALFVLTWLVIRVKTVQLLPLAISEKPVVGVDGEGRRASVRFPEVRNEYR
jgi:hypothetical protein